NTGTIPSKSLREAVLYLSGFHQRGLYGASYRVKHDITMEDLTFRSNHVIKREVEIIQNQMTRNRIELLFGTAVFMDPHRLRVEGPDDSIEHTAGFIIIACGTIPARPAHIPFDDHTIIDTDGLLTLKRLPQSITVIGGGVIGTEYASILATMGIHVTLIERRPRLLEFVDQETVEALQYHMRSIGVTLRFNEEVVSIETHPSQQVIVGLKSGKEIGATTVLYSVGRMGATAGLNLEAVGLAADPRGRLHVNEHYQTAVPHIYAAGDVIGFPALASTSMQQGRHAACHAFEIPFQAQSELMPYGIYSIPEISMVGRNEYELTINGVPYAVGIARYREIARGQLIGDDIGMLKLLFHQKTRELLGVHAIGDGATELIHIGQTVMAYHGQIDYFVDTVFNYPTLAECYRVAALDGINQLPRPWAPRA
ncbi:MAG: Si-specific NAD(P)(+) transhydrogenase, partial [Nitrospirota bacterium]|nr:Si-specific NAD(P)(+) transhydrogenase [Nitrospirota bacterium]